jgi:transcriptional regulator
MKNEKTPALRRLAMTRANMQIALEEKIEQARMRVKRKKSLRDAVRVGIYAVGKRIFAVVDAATGYEVKDGTLTPLTPEEYTKYIQPHNALQASYQFADIPTDALIALSKLFEEVSKQ